MAFCLLVLGGCERAPEWTTLTEYATSLKGRTHGQRRNALLAAQKLHGVLLAPQATLSFNERVGQWVRSEGFVRAPVSYGGVLVPAWGGGVCQTSTTLYNAALLAGLEIVERHPHTIAPGYVPVGLDAAVAQGVADLKIRNPYPFPVRVEFEARGERLICRVRAKASRATIRRTVPTVLLQREQTDWQPPPSVPGFNPQPGRAGVRVRLWRVSILNGKQERELCHESEYLPLPRGTKD
ncbi:Vancomycin B-type resistance protein VanW [bacterium HR15]|nr:Vancomycin B-type resistance protein VanW [bacterium HR15]